MFCARCGINPRPTYHAYCNDCKKAYRREHPEDRSKKYKRVAPFPEMCGKCKQRPHAKGHAWCHECKRESLRQWWRDNPDWYDLVPERRVKHRARLLVGTHISRGKLIKLPCFICGNPQVTAHHYLGYAKEHALDVLWLCRIHHLEADRKLWIPLVPPHYSRLTKPAFKT